MTDLRHARLVVSGDALLTVGEAAALIGGREARAWIEAHVPIRYAGTRRLVLWREVIAATEAPLTVSTERETRRAERPRRAVLRRAAL